MECRYEPFGLRKELLESLDSAFVVKPELRSATDIDGAWTKSRLPCRIYLELQARPILNVLNSYTSTKYGTWIIPT